MAFTTGATGLTRRAINNNVWLAAQSDGPDAAARLESLQAIAIKPEVLDTEDNVGRAML